MCDCLYNYKLELSHKNNKDVFANVLETRPRSLLLETVPDARMGPARVFDGRLDRLPILLQLDLLHDHSSQARSRKETKLNTDRQTDRHSRYSNS